MVRLEALRRKSALEALTLRVESIWKKRAKLHDPDRSRRLEKSVYSEILAVWDRDGTPLGPGSLDSWYLDAKALTYIHNNEPGYLKEEVISRCSAACSTYADLQCSQGKVSRSCTRGRVYRVRFARTGTMEAKNDWFVCWCNSGVMQLAASEALDVVREKNRLLRASLKPEDMKFDTSLHAEEMLPDTHVHCFRDFEKWITQKADFAQNDPKLFPKLDELALTSPTHAEATYKYVRDKWYKECLKEAPPAPLANGTHAGSTDGSLDIFSLVDQPYTKLDVRFYANRLPNEDEKAPEEPA